MKRLMRFDSLTLTLVIACMLGVGCGSKKARYYMLSSSAGLSPVSLGGEALTIGVGPVTLPDYLMRPQIVTRESATEVTMAEFNRWAEPLDQTMVRVLTEHLSALLPDASFLVYPWSVSNVLDYRVKVDVATFERQPDGSVRLEADWSIFDGEGRVLKRERGNYAVTVEGKDFDGIVAAMNRALARLSESVAAGISG